MYFYSRRLFKIIFQSSKWNEKYVYKSQLYIRYHVAICAKVSLYIRYTYIHTYNITHIVEQGHEHQIKHHFLLPILLESENVKWYINKKLTDTFYWTKKKLNFIFKLNYPLNFFLPFYFYYTLHLNAIFVEY